MAKTRRTPDWLRQVEPIGVALTALLHPYGEVAVHDIATDRVVAIWGTMSGRHVGDRSLLSELSDVANSGGVFGPYEKVLLDGSRITSVSAIIRDSEQVDRGMLCINVDRSAFDNMMNTLAAFLAPVVERPVELFEKDWREQIALTVDEYCRNNGVQRHALTRTQRFELVKTLDDAGLFATRNAARHVAQALGISRATVYSSLKETRL